MNAISKPVSEKDILFIEQFEALNISPRSFTHKDHIRLAWIYMHLFSSEAAVLKICAGIKRFDARLGDGTKYHETVTRAFANIVHERIKKSRVHNWENFMTENPDLLLNYKETLYNYYSPEILFSEKAKTEFVSPDKKPL